MDTNEIGTTAGRVWEHLNAKGPTSPQSAMRQLKLKSDAFWAAVGWLAREGKVAFESEGGAVKLSLK